jgi:hypothetical protein
MDERIARLRTHRNNINRYRGLLKTKLTEVEKQYLERRLSEEQSALEALVVPGHATILPGSASPLETQARLATG